MKDLLLFIALLFTLLVTTSCSSLITQTVIEPTIGNLQKQTDLLLVCEGAPAYLLMIDSMIASSPNDAKLLQLGAQSYVGYIAALSQCAPESDRLATIGDKAYLYGSALIDHHIPLKKDQRAFIDEKIAKLRISDVPDIFWGTAAWISWVQQQKGSPSSIADLVIIEKLITRLLELDGTFQQGSPHLFMAGYLATKPAMLGGSPEKARLHFEQALEISKRKFLLTQVTYAETYGRSTFNQHLHDSLLQEVIAFDLNDAPDYTLSNQAAKIKAARLLEENYFD